MLFVSHHFLHNMKEKNLNKRKPSGDILKQVLSLLTCFLMILAVAINRDGRVFGSNIEMLLSHVNEGEEDSEVAEVVYNEGGVTVIDTKQIAKNIIGFAGVTPLRIYIDKGQIVEIKTQENAETPNFFRNVESELLPKWIGMNVDDALAANVDAVTGATLSSNAVIENVRTGLQYAKEEDVKAARKSIIDVLPVKSLCALIVILAACILPFFMRSRRYRIVQLVLNVVVLGLWSGTFLSYSLIVSTLSNGLNRSTAISIVLLLIVAFFFPLIGKKKHYCFNVCPMGSLQELVGIAVKRKWRLSPSVMKRLSRFREALWAVLMLLMWSGIWFKWMDYELFTAFLFRQASPVLIGVAVAFVVLSCFIPRPYCHFVCPTGTLLRLSNNTK